MSTNLVRIVKALEGSLRQQQEFRESAASTAPTRRARITRGKHLVAVRDRASQRTPSPVEARLARRRAADNAKALADPDWHKVVARQKQQHLLRRGREQDVDWDQRVRRLQDEHEILLTKASTELTDSTSVGRWIAYNNRVDEHPRLPKKIRPKVVLTRAVKTLR